MPMYTPPVDDDDPAGPRAGITCFVFPAWFIAQVEDRTHTRHPGPDLPHPPARALARPRRRATISTSAEKIAVVPVRFVQACRNGHISDIDWHRFVPTATTPTPPARRLWIDEGGTGGDLSDIFIRCESTGARRPLADAKLPESRVLGRCRGDRPWLGRNAREQCTARRHRRARVEPPARALRQQRPLRPGAPRHLPARGRRQGYARRRRIVGGRARNSSTTSTT
jgi:hypothetical protein